MKSKKLSDIVADLVTKPGHEKVRAHLLSILTEGLGAESNQIEFEKRVDLISVTGRIDALLGRTVIEIKSDLKRERQKGEKQLEDYIAERERSEGQRFVGILTDGADFSAYLVRNGTLAKIADFSPLTETPSTLIDWLDSVVALNDELSASVEKIKLELGRQSVTYARALQEIEEIWSLIDSDPSLSSELQLKFSLWDRLLRTVYGEKVGDLGLFLQHTYLTVIAKAIATLALTDSVPATGQSLLDGNQFRDLGIYGAVEGDFFDWILAHPRGDNLVVQLAHQANRFALRDIESDILKGLYESLIDPEQRHDLGEYYTPDWLAYRVIRTAVTKPKTSRVIDPACGSGTFLFHAVRHLVNAYDSRTDSRELLRKCTEQICGIDIHPVAVIFARVTFLLAIEPLLGGDRPETISVPVYLGDALQWNTRGLMQVNDLEIVVPAEKDGDDRVVLRFPQGLAQDPTVFDELIGVMLTSDKKTLGGWLQRNSIAGADRDMIIQTHSELKDLQRAGRNHIWGYVARNLSRPIWLAGDPQKADVVVGNPPWLDYRRMSARIQKRFQEEMKAAGLWTKTDGSAFDLSAYFFARAVELYMKREGRIAFVMPFAAMTRKAYKPFRVGAFKTRGFQGATVKFTGAWVFASEVAPLFPVPSCVLFAERSRLPQSLPATVTYYSGHLPRRDATEEEALKALASRTDAWPAEQVAKAIASVYGKSFKAGAKLDPRRLILVERVAAGRLGANNSAPLVRGRIGNQDKKPWNKVSPIQLPVERTFLKPILLGESIAPYRLLSQVEGVIPWDDKHSTLLSSAEAAKRGSRKLAAWLQSVEGLWDQHGKGKTTFKEKIDFRKLLSSQFPAPTLRIVYAKSGTNPACAIVRDPTFVIDHKLYWASMPSIGEAHVSIRRGPQAG